MEKAVKMACVFVGALVGLGGAFYYKGTPTPQDIIIGSVVGAAFAEIICDMAD